jgi:hypothetical protein
MSSSESGSELPKKKRASGRPPALFTYDETIQIRLNMVQLLELDQKAAASGRSRSAIIRAALDGVQVLRAQPTEEERERYRQLVKLATNLNQLIVQARVGQDVQAQARATLDQVQQLLNALSLTGP